MAKTWIQSVAQSGLRRARTDRGRVLVVAALCALVAVAALGETTAVIPAPSTWPGLMLAGLERIPLWAFMLAFAVLPAVGFPILAFYATVGAFTDDLARALLISWSCMGVNMALSYGVARWLSAPLRQLAARRGYAIPRIDRRDEWKVVVMMRASPLPWLMQSCLLALGGARFTPYMVFGLPVQAMVGLGVIVLGQSLVSGDAKWAMIGLFLLMAAYLALSVIRRRSRRLATASDAISPESA